MQSTRSIRRGAAALVAAMALAGCGKREPPDEGTMPVSTSPPNSGGPSARPPATDAAAAPAMASSPGGEWNSAQIDWQPYAAGLRRAQEQHKPVCLIISAAWCPHCKNFSHVFDDPRVVARARDFVMIHVDSDAEPEVAEKNAVDGGYIPRTFFLDANGKIATSIHPTRPRFLYFYDERDPASLLEGMSTAARTLTSG